MNNLITDTDWGAYFSLCSNSTLEGNLIENCGDGIFLESSSYNKIIRNSITNNHRGIVLKTIPYVPELPPPPPSRFNVMYHNNFLNNSYQAIDDGFASTWDNGCEGNYWSDYNGSDLDNDGIGDTYLPWEGVDDRPLMNLYRNACDINHDLKVDIRDVAQAARAFGTQPGDTLWNPHADITGEKLLVPDAKVDIRDISMIARDFGKTYL
jgi:parallel beta-helix repeat protein